MIMEQARKYFNKPIEVEIGDDKFLLSPLRVEDLPEYIQIITRLKNIDVSLPEFLSQFSKEDIKIITGLIMKSLRKSYPNEGTEEEWNDFITSNFNILFGGLLNANTLGIEKSHEMRKKLEHLQKLRDEKNVATQIAADTPKAQ